MSRNVTRLVASVMNSESDTKISACVSTLQSQVQDFYVVLSLRSVLGCAEIRCNIVLGCAEIRDNILYACLDVNTKMCGVHPINDL